MGISIECGTITLVAGIVLDALGYLCWSVANALVDRWAWVYSLRIAHLTVRIRAFLVCSRLDSV